MWHAAHPFHERLSDSPSCGRLLSACLEVFACILPLGQRRGCAEK